MLDAKYAGLISDYSSQLIEIYEKIGEMDAYREELEYHIVHCSPSNLEPVNKLKKLCKKEEWEIYQERILASAMIDELKKARF